MAKEAAKTRELNRTAQILRERLESGGCDLRDFLQIIGYSRPNIQAFINPALDRPLYRFDPFSETISQIDRLGVHRAVIVDPVDVPVSDVVPGALDVPVPVLVPDFAEVEPGDGGNPEDSGNPNIDRNPVNDGGGGDLGDDVRVAHPPAPNSVNADVDDILADDAYYRGEIHLIDEPIEQPWIHEATTNMTFDDEEPPDNEEPCCLCRKNARKMAFTPCGHRCLCHECTFKLNKFARRQNAHRTHYQIKCVLCLIPSTNIVYVRN
ncbi:Protein of unknown function [Cotesia congregata]|uniref:RING-type domain-containing protein n=1 Tax=Cotesia congregata TaxID=51543 RepID=A0A8J2HHT0_COTCN|nr:Protein of unknown function [Cotesia congregata]